MKYMLNIFLLKNINFKMSNPAVIPLVDKKNIGKNIKRLSIEDNIGESIHIHINNIRFDFTILEFLALEIEIKEAFFNLNNFKNINLSRFDSKFLYEISPYINSFKSISIKEKKLKDIKCIVHKKNKFFSYDRFTNLIDTPHFKYLSGDKNSFISYPQTSKLNLSNEERISKINDSIDNKMTIDPLVLLSSDNYLRDGLHRAAVYFHKFGNDFKTDFLVIDHNSKLLKLKVGNKYSIFQIAKSFTKNFIKYVFKRTKDIYQFIKLK